MVAPAQRYTRSQDTVAYNSDSPRKRTRYSSGLPARVRHASTSYVSRTRDLRSPRVDHDPDARPFRTSTARRARRITSPDKPRYNSAADAAAAAAGQVDGYKPREERSWEEFHQDLSLDAQIVVFSADEVDGVYPSGNCAGVERETSPNGYTSTGDYGSGQSDNEGYNTPSKRRPGRPHRRPESMLSGLGSPPAPKVVPIPTQNPRERLNLPKPSYRKIETFATYEADKESNHINYVDKSLASAGFQEFESFVRKGQQFLRHVEDSWQDDREQHLSLDQTKEKVSASQAGAANSYRVEYDMDEQDEQWLEGHNNFRKIHEQVEGIKPAVFEITMTQIEKEWHALERRIPKPNPKPPQTHRPRSSSAAAVNGEPAGAGEEQDTKCAVCDDGDCENSNAIVFCDGCDLAVHQECYGVPFIPEGQWLCRKCQMIGIRSKPVCIFCPNSEGAFKQTTESRWAHLLCAIWIPEVVVANQTFMEPISEVASVPRDRWEKLTCYICLQKMGACIQCGHKACYTAFHVTCAKRAKLSLRQKASHGAGASMDASVLKAYCHRHVSPEWQMEHESDKAVLRAQAHYRKRMRNIEWADSMKSATTALTSQPLPSLETLDENAEESKGPSNAAALKKKRTQTQKSIWRLQSGAPVVPQAVQDAVETALARFGVHKRKEFVAEACKYWTMKRDSRRGAAMLKRLQLQLETFSANEVTRRNFAAMGSIGALRLERRIQMAERLVDEIKTVHNLCLQVRRREEEKLQDVNLLRSTIDSLYFPIPGLIEPVLRKAQQLDNNKRLLQSFQLLHRKLECRAYTSVLDLAHDLTSLFRSVPGLEAASDFFDAQEILFNIPGRDDSLDENQKETMRLAKKIFKGIQQLLREAMLQEAGLIEKLRNEDLDRLSSLSDKEIAQYLQDTQHPTPLLNASSHQQADGDVRMKDDTSDCRSLQHTEHKADGVDRQSSFHDAQTVITNGGYVPSIKVDHEANGSSAAGAQNAAQFRGALGFLGSGGIPWYQQNFNPEGTIVHEERWTGPEVLRGMSEELSEMDDEELQGLGLEHEDEHMPTNLKGGGEVQPPNRMAVRALRSGRR